MSSRKRIAPLYRIVFLLFILLFLFACEHTPEIGPEPLTGFYEKVTALVTATVRGEIRGNLQKQQLLIEHLPSFEEKRTMNELMDEMKGIGPLRDLAYFIETDIMFELQKSEYQEERIRFNAPEIQHQVVSSILAGMKKALAQLKGGKDGK